MARERISDQQPRMDGGLNDVSDEGSLQPNQLRQAMNARLTEYGAVTKRGGTQRTNSTALAASVTNGFSWRKDSTGAQELMAVSNGTLYTAAYGSFPITWTAQSGALSSSVAPTFAQFRDGANDVVYIGDGGLLNKWDGTTLTTDIAGTIGATMIVVHNERLWSCGCSVNPDSIFYSALNDGDTLGNAGANGGEIIVRTFGDENVVSLASVNTSLLIFHRRGISRLTGYGQDDITVAPAGVTADVGMIAAKSVVPVGNVAFFVSERGLYRVNESDVAPVGTVEKPDPILAPLRTLSAAEFDNIRAVFNRATRELWISMPSYGVYVYNTILLSWSGPWDNGYLTPATTALFGALNSNGLPIVLRGDASGYVSLCDAPGVGLDNLAADGSGGTRYTMAAQMHRMYAGDDALAKALRWGYVTANLKGSDQCEVRWNTDTDSGAYTLPPTTLQLWGVGTWGTGSWASGSVQSYRVPMGGTGYYTDVTVVDSGAALPVISRVQLEQFALGRR